MGLIGLIIFSGSVIVAYIIIMIDIRYGKYTLSEDKSILSMKSEEKYLKEFPNYTIEALKTEIAKIADMLLKNQESNRYTEVLREKANKDEQVKVLKEAVVDKVDLIKYNDGDLKARIRYKD